MDTAVLAPCDLRAHNHRMAHRHTWFMGPPALCDACGRGCMASFHAGSPCYHCKAGTFVPRSQWIYTTCPQCDGEGLGCVACNRVGVTAVRKPPCAAATDGG